MTISKNKNNQGGGGFDKGLSFFSRKSSRVEKDDKSIFQIKPITMPLNDNIKNNVSSVKTVKAESSSVVKISQSAIQNES